VSDAPAISLGYEQTASSDFRDNTRPLRVLTLTPFYPSVQDLAQGCFVAEPLSWTERLGIRNEVIAAQPAYRARRQTLDSPMPSRWDRYISLPGNLGLSSAGAFLAAEIKSTVRKLHRAKPFDLIHAHAPLPCGHAAAVLSKSLGVPFIVSVHGLDAFCTRQAGVILGKWCRRASENVYHSASTVICISEAVREQVARLGSAKTAVIYNGVDAERFSPGPELAPPTVLSVGNLIPVKGHALLLKAFARTIKVLPDCRLGIIGEGPERGNLFTAASELGITSQVQFLGRRSRQQVADAMRRCAMFALPSEYEGLGCVYLEAMASGKPIIGCNGQGIAEIIEHGKNGLLVPPKSEDDLTTSLKMLLQNHDYRERLGSAARATVLQRHTLAHQAHQLAEIYRKVAR
jgi:teichuronic acid biosynthesis glycosyltransferase TuaC